MKKAFKIQFMRIREMWPMLLSILFMWVLGRFHAYDSAPLYAMLTGFSCRVVLLSDYQKNIEKQYYIMPLSRTRMVIMNYIQWCLIILLLYVAYLVGLHYNYWEPNIEDYWIIISLLIPAAGFTGVSVGMVMHYWADSKIPKETFWVIVFCYGMSLVVAWQNVYGLMHDTEYETCWQSLFSLVLLVWSLCGSLKAVKTREI